MELQSPVDTDATLVDELITTFPDSLYLLSQKALVAYHQRGQRGCGTPGVTLTLYTDYELAERVFDKVLALDPYRMENVDVYTNILYVMDKRIKLSKLAHEFLKLDKNSPEVCYLVGTSSDIIATCAQTHCRQPLQFARGTREGRQVLQTRGAARPELSFSVDVAGTRVPRDEELARGYRSVSSGGRGESEGLSGVVRPRTGVRAPQHAPILVTLLPAGDSSRVSGVRNACRMLIDARCRPYEVRIWKAMGVCYQDLNKPREAIMCYRRALLCATPSDLYLHLKIAGLYEFVQETAHAAAYHRAAVELGTREGRPVGEWGKSALYAARFALSLGAGADAGEMRAAKEGLERVVAASAEDAAAARDLLEHAFA